MKIKPTPKKKAKNPNAYHYWLVDEKPRKKGRMAQLTKWNQKLRRILPVSEFITRVKALALIESPLLPTTV